MWMMRRRDKRAAIEGVGEIGSLTSEAEVLSLSLGRQSFGREMQQAMMHISLGGEEGRVSELCFFLIRGE